MFFQRSIRTCTLAAVLLASTAPVFAGWSPIGGPSPPNLLLDVAPAHPELLFARVVLTEGPGSAYLWRSRDGGATWRNLQAGLLRPVSAMALDRADSQRLWAWTTGGELWRSGDAGDTWEHRFTSPADQPLPNVVQLLADGDRVIRIGFDGSGLHFAVSRNGGLSFRTGGTVSQLSLLDSVFFEPTSGDLVAFSRDGLEGSADDGATWHLRGRLRGQGFSGGRPAPSSPEILYGFPFGGRGCLARSDDGGRRWRPLTEPRQPVPSAECYDVAVDPSAPLHVWVASRSFAPGGPFYRLFESFDGGEHWSRPLPAPAEGVVAVGGSTLYTGDSLFNSGGLFVSLDSGRSWQARHAGIAAGDLRQGLVAQRSARRGEGRWVAALVQSPGGNEPFLQSSEGGRDWMMEVPAASWLVDAGAQTVVALNEIQLVRSEDQGAHWNEVEAVPANPKALRSGLPSSPFLALEVFEDVGAYGNFALWTSDDAGRSWRRASAGLPIACTHFASVDWCPSFPAYAVDPFDARRRWVTTDGSYPFQPALFQTVDAGATWLELRRELPQTFVLAADPEAQDRLLAGTADGLFISGDGGAHWSAAGAGLPPHAALRQLVRQPRSAIWYAATERAGIFRSQDQGVSWTLLAGAPDLEAPTITVDPRQPEALLAAFAGEGLWRWTP